MNEDPSKKRLGRGLAALIGEMDRLPEENVPPQRDTIHSNHSSVTDRSGCRSRAGRAEWPLGNARNDRRYET